MKINILNNRKIKYLIIFFIICMIISGCFFLILGYNSEKNIRPINSYTSLKSSNYKIVLKPNEFYESETLPQGGYYTSNSIKSMMINLKYNFISEQNADISYYYNVTANLIGTVKSNNEQEKEVWNREFKLIENKSFELLNSNKFFANEIINIDYESYNNLARLFEKTYGVTIDAILKVRLNVYYDINLSKLNENNENSVDYIELDIPINNTVTEIKENYEKETIKQIYSKRLTNNNGYYIIGATFIALSFIIAIVYWTIDKTNITPEKIYNKKLNRILKYYKELIVTVEKEPDIINLKKMNIIILDDLIDLAEQNQVSIIHYEFEKNKQSNFYVMVDGYVYIYILNSKEKNTI